tara:strand:+ start:237 stop:440 length:204 start_codon:yes stop_codon:yes gene_type:complete
MKGMKGIQRSSHPQLTSMVKMLRKQLIKSHEDKKKLSVAIEKYRDAPTTIHQREMFELVIKTKDLIK